MQPIQSAHRVMLHRRAVDAITDYMRENQLKPGDRLPAERVIAQQLGIGRNSLREALRILEDNGAIRVRNGLGIFVGELRAESGINLRVNHQRVNLLELMDIRSALERHAMELCIKNAGDGEIRAAERYLLEMEAMALPDASPEMLRKVDANYHGAIYRAAHNESLRDLLRQIDQMASFYWGSLEGHAQLYLDTLPLHRIQFEALLARNLKRAAEATAQMLSIDTAAIIRARDKVSRDEESQYEEQI